MAAETMAMVSLRRVPLFHRNCSVPVSPLLVLMFLSHLLFSIVYCLSLSAGGAQLTSKSSQGQLLMPAGVALGGGIKLSARPKSADYDTISTPLDLPHLTPSNFNPVDDWTVHSVNKRTAPSSFPFFKNLHFCILMFIESPNKLDNGTNGAAKDDTDIAESSPHLRSRSSWIMTS